ncbi:MAG: type IV secretion system protein [Rickettsiales bacterium]
MTYIPVRHIKYLMIVFTVMFTFMLTSTGDAHAAATPCNVNIGAAICTDNPCFSFDNSFLGKIGSVTDRAKGIMEEAINAVAIAIAKTSRQIFTTITAASPLSFSFTFLDIISACLTLYIIFYGVGLIFGFVQATLLDAFIRLFKIGLILVLIEPSGLLSTLLGFGFFDFNLGDTGGWGFFSNYVINFFNQGTNEIIMLMVNIASGNPAAAYTNPCTLYGYLHDYLPYNVGCPFQVLDESVKIIFSPRMFVTILGAFSTRPYGIIIVAALIMSIFAFFMVLVRAMQVYALSLVAKALLFGIAPIFIAFLLFEKTRGLFYAWLGQVISYSLQPILLFTFLAFFGLLIKSAASDLLPTDDVHLCYVASAQQGNAPIDINSWKFGCKKTATGPVEPYAGAWTWDGPVDKVACPEPPNKKFPMDPVKILIFLLLCYLMYKISDVIVAVAIDLAGGFGASLGSVGGGIQSMVSGGGPKGLLGGGKK